MEHYAADSEITLTQLEQITKSSTLPRNTTLAGLPDNPDMVRAIAVYREGLALVVLDDLWQIGFRKGNIPHTLKNFRNLLERSSRLPIKHYPRKEHAAVVANFLEGISDADYASWRQKRQTAK